MRTPDFIDSSGYIYHFDTMEVISPSVLNRYKLSRLMSRELCFVSDNGSAYSISDCDAVTEAYGRYLSKLIVE